MRNCRLVALLKGTEAERVSLHSPASRHGGSPALIGREQLRWIRPEDRIRTGRPPADGLCLQAGDLETRARCGSGEEASELPCSDPEKSSDSPDASLLAGRLASIQSGARGGSEQAG